MGVDIALEHIEEENENVVRLVKMHGSINWSYCDSCMEVREFGLLNQKKAFEQDQLSYAVIGICRTCGGQRRPLLVPPLAFKFIMFPNLIAIWNAAKRIIEDANLILVVGYSFSEADTYLNKIISRSMATHPEQKIIVCDTNSQLVPTLQEKFKAHIDNFDGGRILKMIGSCEKELPSFLGNLAKSEKISNSKPLKSKTKPSSRNRSNA